MPTEDLFSTSEGSVVTRQAPLRARYYVRSGDGNTKVYHELTSDDVSYNKTSENIAGWLPYFWDNVYQKWRKTSSVSPQLKTNEDAPSSTSKYYAEYQRLKEEYKKALEGIVHWGSNGSDYAIGNTPIRIHLWIAIPDSGAVVPVFVTGSLTGTKDGVRNLVFPLKGGGRYNIGPMGNTPTELEGWYSTDARTVTQICEKYSGSNCTKYRTDNPSTSQIRNLLNQSLHDVFTIIDPKDTNQTDKVLWRPIQGYIYGDKESDFRVPSLNWWLYNQNKDDYASADLKSLIKNAKEKYGYWGKEYFGKSSGLTEAEFKQILTDELNEKKRARVIDLARAGFLPWYEGAWLPAQEALATASTPEEATMAQGAVEAAAGIELNPVVQDKDATLNIIESTEKYKEKFETPNRVPLYILGALTASVSIYIGWLYYKKKKAQRGVQ